MGATKSKAFGSCRTSSSTRWSGVVTSDSASNRSSGEEGTQCTSAVAAQRDLVQGVRSRRAIDIAATPQSAVLTSPAAQHTPQVLGSSRSSGQQHIADQLGGHISTSTALPLHQQQRLLGAQQQLQPSAAPGGDGRHDLLLASLQDDDFAHIALMALRCGRGSSFTGAWPDDETRLSVGSGGDEVPSVCAVAAPT